MKKLEGLLKLFEEGRAYLDKVAIKLDPSTWKGYSMRENPNMYSIKTKDKVLKEAKMYFESYFGDRQRLIMELEREILEDIESSIMLGQLTSSEKEVYIEIGDKILDRYCDFCGKHDHHQYWIGCEIEYFYNEKGENTYLKKEQSFYGNTLRKKYKKIIESLQKINTSINDELLSEAENMEDIEKRIEEEIKTRKQECEEKTVSRRNKEKDVETNIKVNREEHQRERKRAERDEFKTLLPVYIVIFGPIVIFVIMFMYSLFS